MATLVFDIETTALPSESGEHAALSPFTGQIVSLAAYDTERRQGAVYLVTDRNGEQEVGGDWQYKVRTEVELLEDFWETALSYNVFVTFNGRSFDVPFLLHRSLMLGVRPSVQLTRNRYLTKQTPPYHVDLLDEFSFQGATTRPSLAILVGAYSLQETDVSGEDIATLYANGNHHAIAYKNVTDVNNTAALYELWKTHLAPPSFLNAAEL